MEVFYFCFLAVEVVVGGELGCGGVGLRAEVEVEFTKDVPALLDFSGGF